jgi:hypothetical protein
MCKTGAIVARRPSLFSQRIVHSRGSTQVRGQSRIRPLFDVWRSACLVAANQQVAMNGIWSISFSVYAQ